MIDRPRATVSMAPRPRPSVPAVWRAVAWSPHGRAASRSTYRWRARALLRSLLLGALTQLVDLHDHGATDPGVGSIPRGEPEPVTVGAAAPGARVHSPRGQCRFASTLPALLTGGGIDTRLDPVALHHYLTWHSIVPAPRTILRGVRKLPPATLRILEPGRAPRDRCYWQPASPASLTTWR